MAGSLPRARRIDKPDRRLMYALVAAVIVLTGVLVYLLAGGALFGDQPRTDAERDYLLLIEGARKNPKDPAVLMSLAEAEYELGKKADSFEHAEKAVAVSQGQAFYNFRLATLLVREERLEEAEDALLVEISIVKTDDAEPYFLLAQIQADQDRYDEAIKTMEQGLRIDPIAADMGVIYGEILEKAGQKAKAAEQYTKALKFLPEDQRAIDGLKRLGVSYTPTETANPHQGGDAQ